MNIHVSSTPKHLQVTQMMLEDLLWDPVMAVWVFFRVKLDAFQAARLRIMWFTPDVEDHSGFTSAKTIVDWFFAQVSAVLIPDCHIGAIFQTFQIGKDNFWQYYRDFSTPLFRAQLGEEVLEGEEDAKKKKDKSQYKEPGCWKRIFKNGSLVSMPAPGFFQEARNLAGWRVNRLIIDEIYKIMMTMGGQEGITKQLMGRVTRRCFNKDHPVWCNKVIRTSTAEMGNHPGVKMHREMENEAKRGSPDYWTFGFNYKFYSNLQCHTGKTFKEEFRDEKRIKALRKGMTEEKARAEIFGVHQKQSKGWYTVEMVEGCQALGRGLGLEPVISRAGDPFAQGRDFEVRYFLGVDSAPAQGKKSDDGALAVLRALRALRRQEWESGAGENESDWQLSYAYAEALRNQDIDQWSGKIHELHQDFGFSLILMDHGGGGQWIKPKLRKSKQTINGQEVRVKPIVGRDGSGMIEGDMVLCLFYRGEKELRRLWPDLKHAQGDDVLKHAGNLMFQTALSKAMVALPIPHRERKREELMGWVPRKVWASKCLTAMATQIPKVQAEVDDQGAWKLTKNNCCNFFSIGKDDFHDAGRNAYIAFRTWLLDADMEGALSGPGAALCRTR